MSITQRCSKCGRLIPVSEYSEEGFKRQVCKECERAEQEATKPKTKVCECCGRELPIECFSPNRKFKDGYKSKCIQCELFLKSNVEPKFKTCTKCGKTLPLYLFHNDKKTRDGKISQCKACVNEAGKRYRERNKNTPHPPITSKVCTLCGRELPICEFHKNSSARDGYSSWCRDCNNGNDSWYRQKKRMRKLVPGWTAPTQEDIDNSVENIATPQRAVAPTPPKVEQEPTIPYPEEPAPPKIEQDDIDRLVESIPYPPDSPQRIYDLRPPKIKQPVEQATYSPQTLTIRFKAGDKVIRLKDGIFLLEQLSGKAQVNMGEKPEILYETTDGDMVADKDLFKNKREALERTKLANIPEERLTYGNKPIK